jgi:hypothetical protein
MTWIVSHIRWIMIVSGVLTTTMVHAAIAPESALQSTFGETLTGPLAEIVVRNWGVLIALIGAMLIYGAFHPPLRPFILIVAGTTKRFLSRWCSRKANVTWRARRVSRSRLISLRSCCSAGTC